MDFKVKFSIFEYGCKGMCSKVAVPIRSTAVHDNSTMGANWNPRQICYFCTGFVILALRFVIPAQICPDLLFLPKSAHFKAPAGVKWCNTKVTSLPRSKKVTGFPRSKAAKSSSKLLKLFNIFPLISNYTSRFQRK